MKLGSKQLALTVVSRKAEYSLANMVSLLRDPVFLGSALYEGHTISLYHSVMYFVWLLLYIKRGESLFRDLPRKLRVAVVDKYSSYIIFTG